MNYDGFIAACRAQWPEFDDRRRLASSTRPVDRRLQPWLGQIEGMATENKLMLLNLAVANLEADEVYVEIGCYRGLSLVAAADGNADARIYACDNFSQFAASAEMLRKTIATYAQPSQIEFFDMDFRAFLQLAPWQPRRIGVYFYDGGHSFADQYEALKWAIPSLADDALVIVDDTNKRNVRAANRLFISRAPGFSRLLDLRTGRNHSPTWWNGLQVYRFRRAPGAALEPPDDNVSYMLRRLFWDDILLRSRHAYRAFRSEIKASIRRRRNRK
jgi:predicted O-methyltransferase YrrM